MHGAILFILYLGIPEAFFLAVMACDHFVAICDHCCTWWPCPRSSLWNWLLAVSSLYLCDSPVLSPWDPLLQVQCDRPLLPWPALLLSLACSSVTIGEVLLLVVVNFNGMLTIVIVLTSYLFILITSWGCAQQREGTKHFPPAPPASQPSLSSWNNPLLAIIWMLTRWPQCSTLSWFPCWTIWSATWGTRMWKKLSGKSWATKYFRRKCNIWRPQGCKGKKA